MVIDPTTREVAHRLAYGTDATTSAGDIASLLLDDVDRGWAARLPLVVFDAVRNLTVLDRELRRHGMAAFTITGPVLDPLVIDYGVESSRSGSRSFAALCAHHGVVFATDTPGERAEATGRLMVTLVRQHRAKLGRRALGDLWRTQRAWYRNIANSEHPEWPMTPHAERQAS